MFKNLFSSQIPSGSQSRTKRQAVQPVLKAQCFVTGIFSAACFCDMIKICALEEGELSLSYLPPLRKPLSRSELLSSPLQSVASAFLRDENLLCGYEEAGVPPSAGGQVINSAFLSVPVSRIWPVVHRSGINFCLTEKLGGEKNWVT